MNERKKDLINDAVLVWIHFSRFRDKFLTLYFYESKQHKRLKHMNAF